MAQINEFGKTVRKRLIDIDKSQTWLASEIKARTGLCVDSGYFHKIYTGQRSPKKVIAAICEILDLKEEGA